MIANSTARLAPCIKHVQAADGQHFFVRVWNVAQPVGRVFFLHGLVSHGGWYAASCERLASAGFEVHFLDRRGSGLNPAERGHIDRFETWIDDVAGYLRSFRDRGAPILLGGISWGGKLAVAVVKAAPSLVDRLALICPGIHARRGATRMQRWLIRWVSRTPLRHRTVTIPLQDSALFTDVPMWRELIDTDPLVLRKMTLQFAREDLAMGRYIADAEANIGVPTALVLAGRDRIIDNERMRVVFERLASRDKKLLEYPQAAHTLEFEPHPEPYFRDLVEWFSPG